jgi:pyruvate dehydrogenase kinase 2/3/4
MNSKSDEYHHLPESKPKLSLGEAFSSPSNASTNGNGYNRLKLQVPMGRRFVYPLIAQPSFFTLPHTLYPIQILRQHYGITPLTDVALNTQQAHEDYVGIICTKANVHDIVQKAIENARFVCEEPYAMFKGPPVQLIRPLPSPSPTSPAISPTSALNFSKTPFAPSSNV